MANSLLKKKDRAFEEDPLLLIGDQDPEEVLKKINTRKGFVEILLGKSKDEEYNPSQPNDFESLLLKRKRLKKEIEKKIKKLKSAQELIKQQEASRQQDPVQSTSQLDISAEDAYQARLRKSQKPQEAPVTHPESKARKWMESMGWKGKGLGKQEQGILNPLTVKKSDAAAGVILESQVNTLGGQPEVEEEVVLPRKLSKVLVLEEFVEVEDADEDLRDEVKFECERFGVVKNCVVHLANASGVEKGQVRVFVEFQLQESANQAYLDFSTRFFNEKPIRPDFFDEELFERKKFKENSLNH